MVKPMDNDCAMSGRVPCRVTNMFFTQLEVRAALTHLEHSTTGMIAWKRCPAMEIWHVYFLNAAGKVAIQKMHTGRDLWACKTEKEWQNWGDIEKHGKLKESVRQTQSECGRSADKNLEKFGRNAHLFLLFSNYHGTHLHYLKGVFAIVYTFHILHTHYSCNAWSSLLYFTKYTLLHIHIT